MIESKSLVIVMSDPPTLHLLPVEVGTNLALEGRSFVDSGIGDWIGFYDWLRSLGGQIVGVRTWLSDSGTQQVRQSLALNSMVDVDDGGLRVWFSDDRKFDEATSGDQELGTHRFMTSTDNVCALTFNIEGLSVTELKGLEERVDRLGQVPQANRGNPSEAD